MQPTGATIVMEIHYTVESTNSRIHQVAWLPDMMCTIVNFAGTYFGKTE